MRRSIRFRGRVQGVGFRATARSIAARLPLTGWVRNEPDGSVQMEVQGQPDDIEAMLAEVRRIFGSMIESAEQFELASLDHETGFVIRR